MEKLHPPQQRSLQGNALAALGTEMAFIDGKIVDACLQQRGCHPMGVGGGIGVDKAACVRGHGYIQGQGHRRCDLPQLPTDLIDDLPAGGPGGVHTLAGPEALKGGMVVDCQADLADVRLRRWEKEASGGNVHGYDEFRLEACPGPAGSGVNGIGLGDIRIFQQESGFAQLPQGEAEPHGTADGIAVRTAMGQDQDLVLLPQQGGGLLGCHGHHSSSSKLIWALAGLAGLTTSGLRSISRIWAPCSIESSAMNCSSGV